MKKGQVAPMDMKRDIEKLAEEFENCRKVLIALGDENRQHLILEMMRMEDCAGARVGDITEKTHLSQRKIFIILTRTHRALTD